MYNDKTVKEIEKVINDIMSEKSINIEYFNNNSIIRVSSPEMTLVGSAQKFDEAMREVTNECIEKNKYKQ